MTPYYERSGTVIYHGDANEVVPSLSACDLIVTDPPYGVGFVSNHQDAHGPIAGDESREVGIAVLEVAVRATRSNRHAYVFGPFSVEELQGVGLSSVTELVWDKSTHGMGALNSPWAPGHEIVHFGVKGKRGGTTARLRKSTVLRYTRKTGAQNRRHPTEKPVPILRSMIESSSHIGERVLDPFMGVGSTLAAAVVEGRSGVGVDIEERYCQIAAERIDALLDVLERDPEGSWK